MPTIAKVWIEEDCITCDACQDILPEVFTVTDETSFISAEIREDGNFDQNTGRSAIKKEFRAEYSDIIEEAADACPVEIIKFEYESVEASEEPAEAAAPAEAAPVVAPAAAPSADDGVLAGVLAGDRTLTILFGSQTGNATGLAEKTAKLSVAYGLEASVVDMDDFDLANLPSLKRLLIITSTWGEGDMPDNAEALWQATCGANPALGGVNFSVCAIGDTSYDEYCKAGIDWNDKLSALGATIVQEIQLCDVDFDEPWAQWVAQALPRIACVDDSGTFQEDMVEAMIAYGSGDDDDGGVEGDFTPASISMPEISLTLKVFRYDPERGETGHDTIACALPGHATIQDALSAVQNEVDGSLSFRSSSHAGGNPLTGVMANGRVVLADTVRICDLIDDGGLLSVEPLPGHEVLKDLIVANDSWENERSSSKPWMEADPRQGERLASGAPIGVMASSEATKLHQMGDVSSFPLLNAMSDTYGIDGAYSGPAVALQRWIRAQDSRSGAAQTNQIYALLQGNGGVWSEADIGAISRHGANGEKVANGLYAARARLLSEFKFSGKSGRMVKWYARSVKLSGNVNETTLYRQVLGPLGLGSNIMNGVSLRMMLGFTRNGGPMMRGFQGMLMPPAGIGKIPDMFNSKVHNHHEVVAMFNELDRRF